MTLSDLSVRLLIAFVFGGIIGLERQIHGRAAGLRTHILVCLGAAIAVISGIQAEQLFPNLNIDTGRIVAGIITGVGFLGAGTIVRYREGVGGLTTAACIWFVAMIGILCGFSFFTLGGIATILALIVLLLLDLLEDKLPSASYWKLTVKSVGRSLVPFENQCESILKRRQISVKSSTFRIAENGIELSLVLRITKRRTDYNVAEEIMGIDGVTSVKWAHRTGDW